MAIRWAAESKGIPESKTLRLLHPRPLSSQAYGHGRAYEGEEI